MSGLLHVEWATRKPDQSACWSGASVVLVGADSLVIYLLFSPTLRLL